MPRFRLLAAALLLAFCAIVPAFAQSLDPTFGAGNGFTRLAARRPGNGATSIAQQVDGKYVMTMFVDNAGQDSLEIAVLRLLPTGARDTTFGEGGVAYFQTGQGGVATAIALQADGKIVLAGTMNFAMAAFRLTADGRPDSTFGTNGIAVGPTPTFATVTSLAIQADGAILVAGYNNSGTPSGMVERFLPNGTPDPAWDGDGLVYLNPQPWTQLYSIILLNGTPLVVGESSFNSASARFLTLVRLTSTGAYDTGFSGDGIVTTAAGLNSGGRSVALQTSTTNPTKIVVAGYAQQGPTNDDFLVARYALDGTLDTSFDTDGILLKPMGAGAAIDRALVVRLIFSGGNANRIVVVGNTNSGIYNSRAVLKLFLAGTLDTAFDGDGVLFPSSPSGAGDCSGALVVGGRVVIAGGGFLSGSGGEYDAIVSRHSTADGSADATFGINGWRHVDAGHAQAYAAGFLRLPDDRLVIAGTGFGIISRPCIRRLLADGTPDSTFGDGGVQDSLFTPPQSGFAFGLGRQADGKLLVCGEVHGYISGLFLARLHADGAMDRSFGNSGVTVATLADFDTLFAVTCQSDGRILAVGTSRSITSGSRVLVMRFLANGSPDSTFGADANGIITDGAALFDAAGSSIALQPDGRILVLGRGRQTAGGPMRLLAYRFLESGAFDATWAGFGRTLVSFGLDSALPTTIVPASQGRVLVAGHTTAGGYSPFVMRFLANATPDSTFEGDGRVTLAPRDAGDQCYAINERPGGAVMLAGSRVLSEYRSLQTLTRLTASGALDATFGTGGRFDVSFASTGTQSAIGLAFDETGRAIVSGCSRTRFSVFRLQPETLPLAVEDAPSRAHKLALAAPFPNPSRGATVLRLTLPVASRLEVSLHDVAGRRVRQLHSGLAVAGTLALTWDGRDDRGRAVAPGLYFVQANAGGASARTRIVRAR